LAKQVNRYWKKNKMMVIKRLKNIVTAILLIITGLTINAQEKQEISDYLNPSDYIIDGITISGIRYLDTNALIGISGLRIGKEISVPGEAITMAVQKLWDQGLFSDIRITITKIEGDKITLDIYLQERPPALF
jgi:outer membrane protein insertion porin family